MVELAQNYFGNTRSGSLIGPAGAFLVVGLAVVTVLLVRNMNARIRRLPERFEQANSSAQPVAGPVERDAGAATGDPRDD